LIGKSEGDGLSFLELLLHDEADTARICLCIGIIGAPFCAEAADMLIVTAE